MIRHMMNDDDHFEQRTTSHAGDDRETEETPLRGGPIGSWGVTVVGLALGWTTIHKQFTTVIVTKFCHF